MLDIGLIHRKEYELDVGRFGEFRPARGSARLSKGKKQPERALAGKSDASKATNSRQKSLTTGSTAAAGNKKSAAKSLAESNNPVIIAQAPGRIHFLGGHGAPFTGLYLSAAIDRWIKVAVNVRKDSSLRFYAADLSERKRTTLVNLKYKREDRWANYVKVAIHVFAELGFTLKGLNFTIIGNIPQHIGLGSSSAIEVASAVALKALLHARISDQDLIRQLAASHLAFFGDEPPVADYIVGFSARNDQLLLVDEQGMKAAKIKSPFSRCKFILMDSRVPQLGVQAELAARSEALKAGLEMLSQGRQGASFREFAAMDLIDSMGDFPEEIRRRSLHVVQEIRRVLDAGDCLERADLTGFSRLIFHSHESLRDLYEVSCPEIDWMVKRAQETAGVLGARMTGQGFGGCTYTIIKNEAVNGYRERLDDYERIFGFHPGIYEVKIATGSRIVKE
ncbi:MAG: galactokinase [Treponema sp.]|jgi:galactokinase|nr:galactokinase [Treponema sp.]